MSSSTIHAYLRKEIEHLKESSRLFKVFEEHANCGLAIISADFHIVETNSTMRAWFPQLDGTALPVCHACLYVASASVCKNCPAVESIKTGKLCTALIEHFHPDRGWVGYKVSCAPITGEDGAICGVLELAEDVTELVRKEKEYQEHEAHYRQIIENANDGIILFDSDGTIRDVNKKAEQLFGYPEGELIGQPFYVLLPEDKREEQIQALRAFVAAPNDISIGRKVEVYCLKKDATYLPAELTFSFQKTADSITITIIIRDISERKSYEAGLKSHAEELEREVTARTKQLLRSEERYRTLLETANDAIISTDKNGTIIYFNKKAEELFGYDREEVIEQHITALVPGDIWEGAKLSITGSKQGKMLESRGIKKDASTLPVEYTLAVFEKEGEYNLTVIARDISKRKRLELELQDYTSKLEEKVRGRTYELTASQQILKEKVSELSILKEINEALSSAMNLESVLNIILVGATSHHGLGFNRAFLFLVSDDGRSLDGTVAIGPSDTGEAQKIWSEIIGKNLTLKEILSSYTNKAGKIDIHVNSIIKSIKIPMNTPDDILILAVKQRESINVRDAFNHPMVPRSLISRMNCNAFALIPLVAEDNVIGVLWADNAITKNPIDDHDIERLRAFAVNASLAIEKSNLIKKIQAKVEELNQANKELKQNRDRLIRSEKLAAVGEMSATVAHGLRNPLVSIGGFARRLLKKEPAEGANKKYLQIIVEEIDRLETILSELLDFVRPQKLQLHSVFINDLMEDSLKAFSGVLEQKNIRIERMLSADIPALELDINQFRRVLQNLFHNALDAMPDGGVLKVTSGVEDAWVKVSIADTGVGISDDDTEKVFHPFFTSKSSIGLGLAVCNQIIAIHGGHIKLSRQIPHGVIFDIYLPQAKENAEE